MASHNPAPDLMSESAAPGEAARVECLGMTFESDEVRPQYFWAQLKDRWYVPDPRKANDLDEWRTRGLLREFDECRDSSERRLKLFRLEAIRAGFRRAWQARDYATMIEVAYKFPEDVLQEDPKTLMWHDQALTRSFRG